MTRPLGGTAGGRTVYLHIGAPKSGTTFLQEVLWRNRRTLARDGVLYPARSHDDHFRAALDLREVRFHRYDDPAVPGSWQRVVDMALRWRGPAVVISHELLAWAGEDQARRAVESLQPAEVHVVFTARDLARQLPAAWQETVKNGKVAGFAQFLRSVAAPDGPVRLGQMFWGAQDAAAVLGRWGAAVPPARIHVVCVPQPGGPQDLLWKRFAGVIGIDPDGYDIDVRASNVSLGRAEVELLRRVNRALGEKLEWPQYEALVKRWLAEEVLAGRPDTVRIVLPATWHAWAAERSEQLVEQLRGADYDVVGDLAELLPAPPPDRGDSEPASPARPGPDATLDAAAETIADLLTRAELAPVRRHPRWRKWAGAAKRRVYGALARLRPRGDVTGRRGLADTS